MGREVRLKKDLAIIGGLFVVVAALVIFGRGFTTSQFLGVSPRPESTKSAVKQKGTTDVTIGDLRISAEVADTGDKRKKGLSGRDELAIAAGILFVFDKSGSYAFWMKDMKFPIDIIWIDESSPAGGNKIVDIAENAVPEPDKKDEELKRYQPMAQAKYVLEINAGLVRLHNLQIGDTVGFEL